MNLMDGFLDLCFAILLVLWVIACRPGTGDPTPEPERRSAEPRAATSGADPPAGGK